ncbi:MAG TPA: hypothetical protein VJB34_08235 [Bdellovibrionota bacterium]|nr:hypothetical protein [Bdellovibrionota bacterium]
MFTIKNRKVSKFKLVLGGMMLTALFLSLTSFSKNTATSKISAISSSSDKSPSSLTPKSDSAFGLRDTLPSKQKEKEVYRRPFSTPSQSDEVNSRSPGTTYHPAYRETPSRNFPSFWSNFKLDFDLPNEKDIQHICEALHKNLFENENTPIPFSEHMDKNTNLKNAYEELKCPALIKTESMKTTNSSQDQHFGDAQSKINTKKVNDEKIKKVEPTKIEENKDTSSTQEGPQDTKTEEKKLDPQNLQILISSCNQDSITSSDKKLYVWLLKSPDLQEAYLILYSPASVFLIYKFNNPIAFATGTETFLQLGSIPITSQTESDTKECLIQTLNLKITEKTEGEVALF